MKDLLNCENTRIVAKLINYDYYKMWIGNFNEYTFKDQIKSNS